MNYTEKYHLPQWEKTDRVMMEDFNRMCADMEAGLEKNARAAANALAAANSKPTSAAVNKAQSTAEQALSAANAAYSPNFKPFATGSYTGLGENTNIEVTLGFRPSFLIITAQENTGSNTTTNCFIVGNGNLTQFVKFSNTGFTITPNHNWPNMGLYTNSKVYRFLAFR